MATLFRDESKVKVLAGLAGGNKSTQFYKYWRSVRPWVDTKVSGFRVRTKNGLLEKFKYGEG